MGALKGSRNGGAGGRGRASAASGKWGRVPRPKRAPSASELPHALTFFLTSAQRSEVVRVLGRGHTDRSAALLKLISRGWTGGAR